MKIRFLALSLILLSSNLNAVTFTSLNRVIASVKDASSYIDDSLDIAASAPFKKDYFDKFNYVRYQLKHEGKDADVVDINIKIPGHEFNISCPSLTIKGDMEYEDIKALDATKFTITNSGDYQDKNSWNCTTEPVGKNKR